ncbi:MAG: aspartate-semialdehyde dehydrogenase [Acidobacteriota bacterium]
MTSRIPVGLLGATGTVGQRFVERLAGHPWFEIACVAASDRSRGKPYEEAAHWRLPSAIPDRLAGMRVCGPLDELPCRLVFSALDAALAGEVEPELARRGILVFSNASAHRMDDDVPLLLPEVNPDTLRLLERQRRERRWTGGIVTNANCSTIVLALALAPLHRAFEIERVFVTTMQAVSGAGYPGVPSLDILGNVIPDIPEEAMKIERETRKILGELSGERVAPATFEISAMTYRVPVEDGHTESISVELRRKADLSELHAAWEEFRAPEGVRGLPSAPERPIVTMPLPHRPQPRRDVDLGGGMSVAVGGLKPCGLLDWKFTALGHNTIRGAAGASILNAEYACATGLLD